MTSVTGAGSRDGHRGGRDRKHGGHSSSRQGGHSGPPATKAQAPDTQPAAQEEQTPKLKATAEQIRLAKATEVNDPGKDKVMGQASQVMETTGCTLNDALFALHDGGYDVRAAVDRILDKDFEPDNWEEQGKKKKKGAVAGQATTTDEASGPDRHTSGERNGRSGRGGRGGQPPRMSRGGGGRSSSGRGDRDQDGSRGPRRSDKGRREGRSRGDGQEHSDSNERDPSHSASRPRRDRGGGSSRGGRGGRGRGGRSREGFGRSNRSDNHGGAGSHGFGETSALPDSEGAPTIDTWSNDVANEKVNPSGWDAGVSAAGVEDWEDDNQWTGSLTESKVFTARTDPTTTTTVAPTTSSTFQDPLTAPASYGAVVGSFGSADPPGGVSTAAAPAPSATPLGSTTNTVRESLDINTLFKSSTQSVAAPPASQPTQSSYDNHLSMATDTIKNAIGIGTANDNKLPPAVQMPPVQPMRQQPAAVAMGTGHTAQRLPVQQQAPITQRAVHSQRSGDVLTTGGPISKTLRAKVPPPSTKLPSGAVEMPHAKGGASMADDLQKMGAIQFGFSDMTLEPDLSLGAGSAVLDKEQPAVQPPVAVSRDPEVLPQPDNTASLFQTVSQQQQQSAPTPTRVQGSNPSPTLAQLNDSPPQPIPYPNSSPPPPILQAVSTPPASSMNPSNVSVSNHGNAAGEGSTPTKQNTAGAAGTAYTPPSQYRNFSGNTNNYNPSPSSNQLGKSQAPHPSSLVSAATSSGGIASTYSNPTPTAGSSYPYSSTLNAQTYGGGGSAYTGYNPHTGTTNYGHNSYSGSHYQHDKSDLNALNTATLGSSVSSTGVVGGTGHYSNTATLSSAAGNMGHRSSKPGPPNLPPPSQQYMNSYHNYQNMGPPYMASFYDGFGSSNTMGSGNSGIPGFTGGSDNKMARNDAQSPTMQGIGVGPTGNQHNQQAFASHPMNYYFYPPQHYNNPHHVFAVPSASQNTGSSTNPGQYAKFGTYSDMGASGSGSASDLGFKSHHGGGGPANVAGAGPLGQGMGSHSASAGPYHPMVPIVPQATMIPQQMGTDAVGGRSGQASLKSTSSKGYAPWAAYN